MDKVFMLTLDSTGQQVLFYVFVFLTLALVLYAIYNLALAIMLWLKTGGKIKIKDSEVGGSVFPALIRPAHATCPHITDILTVVAKTSELYALKASIPAELILTQMQFFNEKAIEIRSYMLAMFVKKLDEQLPRGTEIVHHPEYTAYCATLLAMESVLKDYFQVAFQHNHFTGFTGDKWTEKKTRHCTALIVKATEFLNLYWRGTLVPRTVLFDFHHSKEAMQKFEHNINAIFDYAREEAVKADARLAQAEKEFHDWFACTITG